MSPGGMIKYKCRQCGRVFGCVHVPDVHLVLLNALFQMKIPYAWGQDSMVPKLYEVHVCSTDKGSDTYGVGDLIGGFEDTP